MKYLSYYLVSSKNDLNETFCECKSEALQLLYKLLSAVYDVGYKTSTAASKAHLL